MGEDGATLAVTVLTSSGLPPTLTLRRIDNAKEIDIEFVKHFDRILAPVAPEDKQVRLGMIRRVQPGEYALVSASLGPSSGPFQFQTRLQAPLRFTVSAREVNYIGSYHVSVKPMPDATETTSKDGSVTTITGLGISFSAADNMRSDLRAFAAADPALQLTGARNAMPRLDGKTD
ncbi:hypothetical protein MASSI9I_90203 [Massilia sp. 9I]|nr:hypothetical protein MASSI9I_90203 [Massilia sp. 9I]